MQKSTKSKQTFILDRLNKRTHKIDHNNWNSQKINLEGKDFK